MALVNPVSILLQNLWQTWVYTAVFLAISFLSGAFIGVLIAFVLACLGSLAYRHFINRLLPVPPRSSLLITGCSSGIGEDAALRFVKMGWLVFATVRKEEDAEKLRKKAGNSPLLHTLLLDVSKAEDISAAVAEVKQRLDKDQRQLMGLINNAAYAEWFSAELSPPDLWRQMFETNVIGSVAMTQAFLPFLRTFAQSSSHGARIVFVSSVVGRFTPAGLASYAASKHSIEAIGDSLRMELRKWRIHVAILQPGAIGTSFYTGMQSTQRISECKTALEKGQLPAGGAVLEHYLQAGEKVKQEMVKMPLESVALTSDALEMALLDSQPLARYGAGWSSLSAQVFTKLPTELYDMAMGKAFK